MCDEDGNLAAEFLCQDGFYEPISKQCGLPFKIDCLGSGRTQLQEPQGTGRCLRLNGKWPVEGTCDQYIDCTSGVERLVTCQNHLVFDDQTGDCEHPDVADRQGCTAESCTGLLVLLHLRHLRKLPSQISWMSPGERVQPCQPAVHGAQGGPRLRELLGVVHTDMEIHCDLKLYLDFYVFMVQYTCKAY